METNRGNFTIILFILIAGIVGAYIYHLNKELNKAKAAEASHLVEQLEDVTKKRDELLHEVDSIEQIVSAKIQKSKSLQVKINDYKKRSDEYYANWQAYKSDANDTSLIALLNLLRAIAGSDNTSPSADHP